MKNQIFILIFVCLTFVTQVFSQLNFEKTYGETGYNNGAYVIQKNDGGYLITGNKSSDFYIINTDEYGDTIWTKTYGGQATDRGVSILETNDNKYIIVGVSGGSIIRVNITKIDIDGNILWSKIHYGPEDAYFANSIMQISDSSFVVFGYSGAYQSEFYNIHLLNLNNDGDSISSKTIEGYFKGGGQISIAHDSGYVITGSKDYSFFIMKTTNSGEILWTKNYDFGLDVIGRPIAKTEDGGYIVGGTQNNISKGNYDLLLVKTNQYGDTSWTKTYGSLDEDDFCVSVEQTTDGGFMLSGNSNNSLSGNRDIMLVKTDQNGNEQWIKKFGGDNIETGGSASQTSDDGYIITGGTESFGAEWRNVYLIKTDANGITVGSSENQYAEIDKVSIFPNPTRTKVNLAVNKDLIIREIYIFNQTGRKILSIIAPLETIDISNLKPGLYFVEIKTNEGDVMKKIIIR